MVRNGNVQKDSVLTFTRASGGRVTAAADGTELATGVASGCRMLLSPLVKANLIGCSLCFGVG